MNQPVTDARYKPEKLPLAEAGRDVSVGGHGENLQLYIEPVNSDRMHERIGTERVIREDSCFTVTRGKAYRMAGKTVTGGRYLYKNDDGEYVGGLNYTTIGFMTVISNIYVRPDYRRTGVATRLMMRAQWDFPDLRVDNAMTEDGAKLFGYADLQSRPKP